MTFCERCGTILFENNRSETREFCKDCERWLKIPRISADEAADKIVEILTGGGDAN